MLFFGVPGMAGAYVGAHLSGYVSASFQMGVFAVVMLAAAWFMLRPKRDAEPTEHASWKILLEGLAVGVVTGFVGVGGGFLIVPALVLLGGLRPHLAIGTSLMIIALKSGAGLFKYLDVLAEQGLSIDWAVVGIFVAAGDDRQPRRRRARAPAAPADPAPRVRLLRSAHGRGHLRQNALISNAMRPQRVRAHYPGVRPCPLRPLLVRFRRDGDAAAMEELVGATRTRLLAVARRIGAKQDAPDTVQAAYHALLARPEIPDAPLLAWLLTTVVRIAYRRKAVTQRDSRIADRLARTRPDTPADRAARAEAVEIVRAEVANLPDRYRNPVVLFHLEGLSIAETARLLEIPASTFDDAPATRTRHAALAARAFVVRRDHARAVAAVRLDKGAGRTGRNHESKDSGSRGRCGPDDGRDGRRRGFDRRGPRTRARGQRHAPGSRSWKPTSRNATPRSPRSRRNSSSVRRPRRRPSTRRNRRAAPCSLRPSRFERRRSSMSTQRARRPGRLGVTEHDLEVAVHAYRALRTGSDPKVKQAAIEALLELGDRRTAAAAAVFRGISDGMPGGAEIGGMIKHAFAPGQEHHLINVLKDDVTPVWTKGAIMRNLGSVDTPAVRDYLVERIAAEEEQYAFCDLATSIGELKEERAVPHCVGKAQGGRALDRVPAVHPPGARQCRRARRGGSTARARTSPRRAPTSSTH